MNNNRKLFLHQSTAKIRYRKQLILAHVLRLYVRDSTMLANNTQNLVTDVIPTTELKFVICAHVIVSHNV